MRAEIESDAPRSRPLSRAEFARVPSSSRMDGATSPRPEDEQSEWARQEQQVSFTTASIM